MVDRETIVIRKKNFVKVGVITFLIFAAGLALGFIIDTYRSDILTRDLIIANLESESFLTSQLYLEGHEDWCNIMEARISYTADIVDRLGDNLGAAGEKMVFYDANFYSRRYFIYEIRFWMLAENFKRRCEKKIDTVLFFYRTDDSASYEQGLVLTALKEKFEDTLLVFSLDIDFEDEPTITLLKNDFNVSSAPAVVVNGKKYEGLLGKEELEGILEE